MLMHQVRILHIVYRKFHSAALLRIYNDHLVSISQPKLSALVLLDLSAAFGTIDHNILLSRLTSNFGVSGSALSLISSYLSNRSQSVFIQSHVSPSAPISTGVPQGSVLGPLLFCLYTTPLTYLFQAPLFPITFTLTILNSIFPSLLLILFLIFPSFLLLLILSLIGLLQIASQSIPQKLNFFLLALLNNVPSLPHPL